MFDNMKESDLELRFIEIIGKAKAHKIYDGPSVFHISSNDFIYLINYIPKTVILNYMDEEISDIADDRIYAHKTFCKYKGERFGFITRTEIPIHNSDEEFYKTDLISKDISYPNTDF